MRNFNPASNAAMVYTHDHLVFGYKNLAFHEEPSDSVVVTNTCKKGTSSSLLWSALILVLLGALDASMETPPSASPARPTPSQKSLFLPPFLKTFGKSAEEEA